MRSRQIVCTVVIALCASGVAPPDRVAASPAPGPDPVIIVAATGATADSPIPNVLAGRLTADGYDVTTYYLPGAGMGDVQLSASALPATVDAVLARTGATRVDLVGHSQGGVVARYYIKYLGGNGKVDSVVGLAAPHQGSQLANLIALADWDCFGMSACTQSAVGSPFLIDLNGDDETFGSATYTNFATRYDIIVVPYTNSFQGDGATNVVVQDQCPGRLVGHITMVWDGATADGVDDALARRPIRLDCWAV